MLRIMAGLGDITNVSLPFDLGLGIRKSLLSLENMFSMCWMMTHQSMCYYRKLIETFASLVFKTKCKII